MKRGKRLRLLSDGYAEFDPSTVSRKAEKLPMVLLITCATPQKDSNSPVKHLEKPLLLVMFGLLLTRCTVPPAAFHAASLLWYWLLLLINPIGLQTIYIYVYRYQWKIKITPCFGRILTRNKWRTWQRETATSPRPVPFANVEQAVIESTLLEVSTSCTIGTQPDQLV